jgi:hypothetical protein
MRMNRAALAETCRKFGLRRLSLFDCHPIGHAGTAVLVEMPMGEPVDLPGLESALDRVFGAHLEVFTEATLPPRARHYVLTIARIEYVPQRPAPKRAVGLALALAAIPLGIGALLLLIAAGGGDLSHPISAIGQIVSAHHP